MNRVVITGLGCVTSIGENVPSFWKNLLAGKCGIQAGLGPGVSAASYDVQQKFLKRYDFSGWIDAKQERQRMKFFAMQAAKQAIMDAKLLQVDSASVGVCIGSGIGSLNDMSKVLVDFYKHGYSKISPRFITDILNNTPTGQISIDYGFRGPNHTISTACATGVHSIGDSWRLVRNGDAQIMVAGASEACISPLVIAGFAKCRSLARNTNNQDITSLSRPFDDQRTGFVVGEGAGVLILENLVHAVNRGAKIYCEIIGYGLSSDANTLTSPDTHGQGALLAMQKALKEANKSPNDLDYINAHATGTLVGDKAEISAISMLLQGRKVLISSNKGALGHLLGAAGAVESIATVLAIRDDKFPPNLNLQSIKLLNCPDTLCFSTRTGKADAINIALKNGFGFGGTNASLVFCSPNHL